MSDILSKKQVLKILPMSPRLLDYLIAAGEIPHKRAGSIPGSKGYRTLLFSHRQLLEWVESGNAPRNEMEATGDECPSLK